MFNANWFFDIGRTESAVYGLVGGGLMLTAYFLQKLRQRQRRLTAAMVSRVLEEYATSGKFAPRLKMIGVLLAAALVSAGSAHSTTIINGTPSMFGGGLVIDTFVGAESFTLSTAETIKGIEFALQEYAPTFNDTLNYFIYANNGFFPGSILEQGTNPVLSQSFFFNGGTQGLSLVKYDFNITPLNLSAGTYWVGLNFSGGNFPVWDATTTPNAQLSAGMNISTGNWNLDAVQLYLGVSDTPLAAQQTPEPGTILFAGLGLAALVWHRTRTRLAAG